MYDGLTTRYTFACPEQGDARVSLSSFRRVERLLGTAHPALYRVDFECRCGAEHPGLLTHEELDLALLAAADGAVGLAVRCPACDRTSINLVSEPHVDLPFHNDAEIGVVEHVFEADAAGVVEEFAAELHSARFDARRLALE